MTLGDLFSGNWTAVALWREVYPFALVAIAAFFAGYERGQNVALSGMERQLDRVLRRGCKP